MEFLIAHITELMLGVISVLAVMVNYYRARTKESEAAAAAVSELAAASADMRQRITKLEDEADHKELRLAELRKEAAKIPLLQAQINALIEELTRVRGEFAGERRRLTAIIAEKDSRRRRTKNGSA